LLVLLTLSRDPQLAALSWIDYQTTGLIVFGQRLSAVIPNPESRGREDSGAPLGWSRFLQVVSVLELQQTSGRITTTLKVLHLKAEIRTIRVTLSRGPQLVALPG
jgi:hypothetical protein